MGKAQEQADAAATIATAAHGLDPAAQLELVQRGLPDPDQKTTNLLWILFVAGVLVLIGVLARYMYDLMIDDKPGTDPAMLGQLTTFLAGALVGLFVKSPIQRT